MIIEHANSSRSNHSTSFIPFGLTPFNLMGWTYFFCTKTCRIYFFQNGKLELSNFLMLYNLCSDCDNIVHNHYYQANLTKIEQSFPCKNLNAYAKYPLTKCHKWATINCNVIDCTMTKWSPHVGMCMNHGRNAWNVVLRLESDAGNWT